MQLRVCFLPTSCYSLESSCCCSYCLCLCSASILPQPVLLCSALLGCCYCCGGHYFLYLIALLSAAVFCYICCNMHERTTIMYFDQAGQAPEPHTAQHHLTSPHLKRLTKLKLRLVSFLGCTFSKESQGRRLWRHQMIYTLISVHRTCREIRCGRLVARH